MVKFIKALFSIYALLTFIIVMLLVAPFILLGACFGHKGVNFIYSFLRIWARLWYLSVGVLHKSIYLYPHNSSKQYVFVANHASYLDIPPVIIAIKQSFRPLGKEDMVKYPVFGLLYKLVVITVKRESSADRQASVRKLTQTIKQGMSIFLFPEGTFNESYTQPLKSFYNGAFKIAIETQTPIKPLLFIDAVERLHFSSLFSMTPGKNRVVFLQEIGVDGYTMNDVDLLKQKVYEVMDAGLRAYRNYPGNTIKKQISF